ncbi:MAG: fibronectin type III domain-containing protein [Candidatus Yonathbacteria bacterium]|nr:fibronectin type III domain-containing protein [Candidatus Yonathbacteria bacterium]
MYVVLNISSDDKNSTIPSETTVVAPTPPSQVLATSNTSNTLSVSLTKNSSATLLPPINGPFSVGMTGSEVGKLQQMLAQDKSIYPEGVVTNNYGPETVLAVQRFQSKYNLITGGTLSTTGFGLAGPSTRDKLNQLYAGVSLATPPNPSKTSVAVKKTKSSSAGDTRPPTAPSGIFAKTISDTQINVGWGSATDNVGVAGYRVYRNGVYVGATPNLKYANINLSPGTLYSFTVVAYDKAGNVSQESLKVAVRTSLLPLAVAPPPVSGSMAPNAIDPITGQLVYVADLAINPQYTPFASQTSAPPPTPTPAPTPTPTPTPSPTPTPTPTPPPPAADTTPPSTPTGLTATAISSTQINLSWTASTDNVGVTSYRIYQSGTQITTVAGTTYSRTGLSPSTQYSYAVSAYDAAGNGSPQSTGVSATTSASPQTPTIYTVTITSNGTISPASLTIAVGDIVNFTYISSGGEASLQFSPALSTTIKIDSEKTQKSYTFTTAGTYTYSRKDGSVTQATIIVK